MELHTFLKKEREKLLYLKLHLCAASGRAHSSHSNSYALNSQGPGKGQTAFGLVTVCAEQAVPCSARGEATPEGGLSIWGGINLMEGYGGDNPGAKSQGMKQLMAGGGIALIGITLVPLLSGLFG